MTAILVKVTLNTITLILQFTDPNQILEFIFIYIEIKTEKITGPNKFLLVLGRRTGVHRAN